MSSRTNDGDQVYLQHIFEGLLSPIILLDSSLRLVQFNRYAESILQLVPEHQIGLYAARVFPWLANKLDLGNSNHANFHCVIPTAEGERHVEVRVATTGNKAGYIVSLHDVTKQKMIEEELRATQNRLLDFIEFLPDPTFALDASGTVTIWNRAMEVLTNIPKTDMLGKGNLAHSVPFWGEQRPTIADMLLQEKVCMPTSGAYREIRWENKTLFAECFAPSLNNGDGAYVWIKAAPLYDRVGAITGVIETIRDISDRKALEAKLTFISWHDGLTGLHNRGYWQRKLDEIEAGKACPVSMILCDVDGLKLINDTVGHDAGDRMLKQLAEILAAVSRQGDIPARIGGDEFSIILPHTNQEQVLALSQALRQKIDAYNTSNQTLPLSVSIGIAVKIDPEEPMVALVKRADDRMYREKLNRSHSARNALVQALTLALKARDYGTEGHTQRVQQLATRLATALGLPGPSLNDLHLLAQFHDIGKVGISDNILHKTEPFTAAERQEMQRHTEIGHRIATASPDLAPIADLILKHHEWWNGKGYPLGLIGEAIPLTCRILAIADAYDAMTSDRPYRKAMASAAAVAELVRCAGTQFDPTLVSIFVELIEQE